MRLVTWTGIVAASMLASSPSIALWQYKTGTDNGIVALEEVTGDDNIFAVGFACGRLRGDRADTLRVYVYGLIQNLGKRFEASIGDDSNYLSLTFVDHGQGSAFAPATPDVVDIFRKPTGRVTIQTGTANGQVPTDGAAEAIRKVTRACNVSW